MPETIANFAYAWMSALIVLIVALIAWLLSKGYELLKEAFKNVGETFKAIRETLEGIRADLTKEHDERVALRAELLTMRRICDERHTVRRSEDR